MLSSPKCPLCESHRWKTIGTHTWKKSDRAKHGPVMERRFRVLYEVWCPGAEEFTANSVLCQECGLVIYSPRPSVEDINAKYRFLVGLGPDTAILPIGSEYYQIRQKSLFDFLAPRLPQVTGNRLLDFGGGDGRLMQHFLDRGDQGYIVDYVRETVPGVTKLADTLDELGVDEKFSVLIAGHVLEHVAEPLQVLKQLVSHLAPDGRVFIEVPMEIWKKQPLLPEPVTHVNFFTAESVSYMMIQAGLELVTCQTLAMSLPKSKYAIIRAVGRLATSSQPLPQGGARAVEKLLNPSLLTKLWWLSLGPDFLRMAVTSRLKKLWPFSKS